MQGQPHALAAVRAAEGDAPFLEGVGQVVDPFLAQGGGAGPARSGSTAGATTRRRRKGAGVERAGWGGNHAWGPAFVLTHPIPAGWPRPDSTVHFVTDGIKSAVSQAKAAAGGKSVGVHGADIIQQCLNAGLLDEIHVDIAAVLLGSGVRLFDRLARTPAVLGNPKVIPGAGVTHLRYPVRKAWSWPTPRGSPCRPRVSAESRE